MLQQIVVDTNTLHDVLYHIQSSLCGLQSWIWEWSTGDSRRLTVNNIWWWSMCCRKIILSSDREYICLQCVERASSL